MPYATTRLLYSLEQVYQRGNPLAYQISNSWLGKSQVELALNRGRANPKIAFWADSDKKMGRMYMSLQPKPFRGMALSQPSYISVSCGSFLGFRAFV